MTTMQTSIPGPRSRLPQRTARSPLVRTTKLNNPEPSILPRPSGVPGVSKGRSKLAREEVHQSKSMASTPTTPLPNFDSPNASSKGSSNSSAINDNGVESDNSEILSDGCGESSTTSVSSRSSRQSSRYNGPQLVEACVANALSHVLEPCGHRVLTRDVQPCGKNCTGSESMFANPKTKAKFVCAICISRYVQEHYAEKKALFLPSLDSLEVALGGFEPGWKDQRIARMERIWRNDALEEQTELEKLGRHCAAISFDPEEEGLMVIEKVTPTAPSTTKAKAEMVVPHHATMQADRLRLPVAKSSPKTSQLPAPTSLKAGNENVMESQRAMKKRSRIPVGPRLPRRYLHEESMRYDVWMQLLLSGTK